MFIKKHDLIITDGAFLGAEKLALIGTQVHALFQTDFGSMNAKQKAEFIAERVAEIIKMALADQIGRKIIHKAKIYKASQYLSTETKLFELATPEGERIQVRVLGQDAVVLNRDSNVAILNQKKSVSTELSHKTFKHNFKYHDRIRVRALNDPMAHNFPYTFDDVILKAKPILQEDGSLLYRMAGAINKTEGFFEIAINMKTQTIFHRSFVGK